jgi:hypothetical protein
MAAPRARARAPRAPRAAAVFKFNTTLVTRTSPFSYPPGMAGVHAGGQGTARVSARAPPAPASPGPPPDRAHRRPAPLLPPRSTRAWPRRGDAIALPSGRASCPSLRATQTHTLPCGASIPTAMQSSVPGPLRGQPRAAAAAHPLGPPPRARCCGGPFGGGNQHASGDPTSLRRHLAFPPPQPPRRCRARALRRARPP